MIEKKVLKKFGGGSTASFTELWRSALLLLDPWLRCCHICLRRRIVAAVGSMGGSLFVVGDNKIVLINAKGFAQVS